MERSKSYLLRSVAAALLAGAGLVSCSKDDTAAPAQGEALPAGQYPLTLTASVEGMTTRSDGKDAWTGDGTEYIAVRMVTGETTTDSKYVISNTAGTSVQPAEGSETLYWQSSAATTITSWYPSEAQTDVDITDQSSGFAAFDYLTATAEDQIYGNTVELKFKHQMAKVSYTLTSDAFSDDDLNNATVLFAGYTTASFSEGTLTTSETENGWITPTDEDVLLVPQNMAGKQFIKVSINGSSYAFTPAADTDADLQAGCHYTYNITVKAEGLEVTASSSNIDWGSGSTASGTFYAGNGYTYSTDASGTRTYTVYDETGLNAWAEYASSNLSTNCTLAKDITLTAVTTEGGSNWTAVGNSSSNSYIGTFDGNSHTITNLTINASSNYQGLIGFLDSGGVVKNLTLKDVNISATNWYNGAVVGFNRYGTITDCTVTGNVSGRTETGGVVGCNYGTVTNCCFATGTVTGGSGGGIGGVVGTNPGTVIACYSTGDVTGYGDRTGGVVGSNNGAVTACYSMCAVTGNDDNTGGVVGRNDYGGTITACYFAGAVSSTGSYTGGVVGYNTEGSEYITGGSVTTCYWTNSSSDTGAAEYGIGSTSSNDNATKVDDDVTWSTAKDAMNAALTGTGWQYDGDGTSDPPLTLVAE